MRVDEEVKKAEGFDLPEKAEGVGHEEGFDPDSGVSDDLVFFYFYVYFLRERAGEFIRRGANRPVAGLCLRDVPGGQRGRAG